MKIDLIIAYLKRYEFGHEKDFVPPITGIHLAALIPKEHSVRVFHQQVDAIDYDTDADLIAISFFSGFAPAAFKLAAYFRAKGKTVIAGGPHVTFNMEESLQHFDSIAVGETESFLSTMLEDIQKNELKKIYKGEPTDLKKIPTPRFDLLSDNFFIKKVIQATRGCPFSCSFCTVPVLNPKFRLRPVDDVIKDASYDNFTHWWQRKVVWFWDDNLTIDREYITELLTRMKPLKKWWLTQASLDIAKDDKLLELMKESGCIGVFLGIESFGKDSLADANKKQNKIESYKIAVASIRKRGIAVMAGFIAGFDHDTTDSIEEMSDRIMEIGIDVPFLSIMTPFAGTPVYKSLKQNDRILENKGWQFYNGYNVAFKPKQMTPDELLNAHRNLWKKTFSFSYSVKRIFYSIKSLNLGSIYLSVFMNGFYMMKKIRKNYPINMNNQLI